MGANQLDKLVAVPEDPKVAVPAALAGDGVGCHSGKDAMLEAAKAAGKSETLAQYALPDRMVAVRRMRRPTRSEPKAGHMLCGWSCGPAPSGSG